MKKASCVAALLLAFVFAGAQDLSQNTVSNAVSPATTQDTTSKAAPKAPYYKNVAKFGISSLAFNNYHFFYERSISRKITVSGAYRYMPSTLLTNTFLIRKVLDRIDNGTVEKDLDNATFSGSAFTAEIRFYTGKKPGAKGLYAGLYGRYTAMHCLYRYDYESETHFYSIPIGGDFHVLGGGFILGAQFAIARRVFVDFTVLGAQYGSVSGHGSGEADLSGLSPQDQQNIKNDLESKLEVGDRQTVTAGVGSSRVDVAVSGPFIGIRALNLAVGIGF